MKRLNEIASHVSATIIGNENLEVFAAASINLASHREITFATNRKYFEKFLKCQSMVAVVAAELQLAAPDLNNKTVLCVDDPESAFATIVQLFRPPIQRKRIGVSPAAYVSPSARISEDVEIHPGAHIADGVTIGCGSVIFPNVTLLENTVVGTNVKIYPNAVLYENTIVGDRSIIHSGAILGAYGFGYHTTETGHTLSAQLGNVEIGSDVEIGANTTIDRGTYESTKVGQGSKIDNQVMIAHNCQIGEANLLCSQVGIAGSSSTGDRVVMAGQVGIGDHLSIGTDSVLCAKSGVMHDLKGGQVYAGAPAVTARESMQSHALIAKLPEMRKKLKSLQKTIHQLEAEQSAFHQNGDAPKPPRQNAA